MGVQWWICLVYQVRNPGICKISSIGSKTIETIATSVITDHRESIVQISAVKPKHQSVNFKCYRKFIDTSDKIMLTHPTDHLSDSHDRADFD